MLKKTSTVFFTEEATLEQGHHRWHQFIRSLHSRLRPSVLSVKKITFPSYVQLKQTSIILLCKKNHLSSLCDVIQRPITVSHKGTVQLQLNLLAKELFCGKCSGLMIGALDSGVIGPASSPGWGHCVVFLGKTLYSHGASLHPGVY